MQFIDEVNIIVRGGDGGDGAVAFRRERFKPKGGPCGGDGGKGGDVILKADRNVGTLLDLRYRHRLDAKRGQNGQGSDCHGRGADDTVVRVPVGTAVYDDGTGDLVGDLIEDGHVLVAAKGGLGGQGNMRFATSSNRAPRKSTPGGEGEQRVLRLELKLLADVGLVGLPSVGKSSLISRFSAARPKVAEYPFTTLVPNLGVVEIGPGSSFVMADIPGLVRGASRGAGLGHRFLRHIQRTAILVHVVAPDPTGENDLLDDLDALSQELAAFDEDLASRPSLVALNKIDLTHARESLGELRKSLDERGIGLVPCSAATGEGLDRLKAEIVSLLTSDQ